MKKVEIEGKEVYLYETMCEYVQDADLSEYEIAGSGIRDAPFVEDVKPVHDPSFLVKSDGVFYDGKFYNEVNFGEEGPSYLYENALYDTVYLIYIEREEGVYVPFNGRVIETRDEAERSL
jgi:hypothetical protein